MSWLSSNTRSQTRRAGAQGRTQARAATELIRAAMLRLLDTDSAEAGRAGSLARRVLYAPNAERLWYLRSEVMSELAGCRGEAAAREMLAEISILFREVLPEGLASPLRARLAVAGVR